MPHNQPVILQRSSEPAIYQYYHQQNIHPLLARLLASREPLATVRDPDCTPSLELLLKDLIPPLKPLAWKQEQDFQPMLGIEAACEQLMALAQKKAQLVIIADYDCDGATACSLAVLGLQRLLGPFGLKINYLVPNRFTFGYGLTPEIVDWAKREYAPDALLTVDNGIASIAGVEHANELGIDVIVTDHHLSGDVLPAAKAIVNPNQPHCPFPSKHLAGVGVIFYVLMALRRFLAEKKWIEEKSLPRLDDLLPLVALGTVADVVTLDRNNRILVLQGLKRIRAGIMPLGLKALFEVSGRDYRFASSTDLGFFIGPRINAAGRLEDMSVGIECLTTSEPENALALAIELHEYNQARKAIETEIKAQITENLPQQLSKDKKALVLYDEHWHEGVIGIVAGRLKEQFHRPVIVFAKGTHPGELKGSGRSIAGFHLRDAIDCVTKKYNNHGIIKYGGHAMAAGLTLREQDFSNFVIYFERVAQDLLSDQALDQIIWTDGELHAQDWDLAVALALEDQVWGQGFPEPLFEGDFVVVNQQLLQGKHLRLTVRDAHDIHAVPLEGIWFNQNSTVDSQVRLLYRLSVNRFRGEEKLQLMIMRVIK